MNVIPRSILALLALAVALGSGLTARADPVPMLQPAADAAAVVDPPARVGRLSDLSGTVWWFSPDNGDWVRAERNLPLTSGNRIATDAGARAEIRIGSTTVRLDAGTELHIDQLDDSRIALQLAGGTAMVRLRDGESARQFALATADGRFITPTIGAYRFDILPRASDVTVWSGAATYQGPGSALGVAAGQRAEFWLDEHGVAQYVLAAPTRDDFAVWSEDHDRTEDAGIAARYVSPEMTGIEDLDRNGTWEQTPEDGAVWVPTLVAAGWVPYSTGHWAWVAPWGWTWVDDAPWGFAPFHYGRWVHERDRWAWAPGRYVARPCYAPALVGWFGGGAGAGPRGAAPAVGWFPLAPHEVYVPRYRVSPGYVRNVNVTQVTTIANLTAIVQDPDAAVRRYDYRNRRDASALTVVPASVLVERQQVAPAAAAFRRGRDGRGFHGPDVGTAAVLAAPPVAAPSARVGGASGGRLGGNAPRSAVTGTAQAGGGSATPQAGPLAAPPRGVAIVVSPTAAPAVPGATVERRLAQPARPGWNATSESGGRRVDGLQRSSGVERRSTPAPEPMAQRPALRSEPAPARLAEPRAPAVVQQPASPQAIAPPQSPRFHPAAPTPSPGGGAHGDDHARPQPPGERGR